MPHFEIDPKTFSVRVYGDDPDNYVAAFNLFKEGDTVILTGLNGKGFYALVLPMIIDMMDRVDANYVEATVLEWHAALIERKLSGTVKIERVRPVENAGRAMVWVRLSRLEG
jgi:hypothetical protein